MNSFKLIIGERFQDKSVNDLLKSFYLSQNKINSFNQEGLLYLNGNKCSLSDIVKYNDVFEVELKEKIDLRPQEYNLEVYFEDKYFLVVNKPRGMIVHDDGTGTITLNNLVAYYYQQHHIRRKIRACNRLDCATSGLVIYAKDPLSEAFMNYLIRERKIEKKYYALCHHRFSKKEGVISFPLGRDRHNSHKMIVNNKGKEALTEYKVLKDGKISLCEVKLLTGRTHQIRVHFAYINHTLIGDDLYGDEENPLYLQSYQLKFIHPFTNEDILIKMDIDSIFIEYMRVYYGK